MPNGFDRGTVAGVVMLAATMVGIVVTSYVNTHNLRAAEAKSTESREFLDAIGEIRTDTRNLQATQRSFLITGFQDRIEPYRQAAGTIRADAAQLVVLTAGDADQHARALSAREQIEAGIASMDAIVELRSGPDGHAAVVALARERGQRSFVDPLLETLAEMERAERTRLAEREAKTRESYDRAIFYGISVALLGILALLLFVLIFRRDVLARMRDASLLANQREFLNATLTSIGDAVVATDAQGKVTFLNAVATNLTGWSPEEAAGRPLDEVLPRLSTSSRTPIPGLHPAHLANELGNEQTDPTLLIARDGTERAIEDSAAPIRDGAGEVVGAVIVFRDITLRLKEEFARAEQTRLTALRADVATTLSAAGQTRDVLKRCCEALVEHLDLAFVRVWTLNEATQVLELQASAGMYTHLDGPHSRVPLGELKIGRIASTRQPHLSNAVTSDPNVGDRAWAKREGMVAFAGYPLIVDGRVVGVMAMFARHTLSEAILADLAPLADGVAQYVERRSSDERFREEAERNRVTLASIGDAVIATDIEGKVLFLNAVAEGLTGWNQSEARGESLERVFHIVNESTRAAVENPARRALREGSIVGLANHTVLIARDGTERPIDDSAAPIRDSSGSVVGAVLVCRDITERKRADAERERLTETLSLALSAADLGTWEWDPSTDSLVLSRRSAEIFDVSPGVVYSREWMRERIHPDYRQLARTEAARSAAERTDYDLEYPLERLGGSVWVSARGRGAYDAAGKLVRMLGVVQDVTARKRAEVEREALYREVDAERQRLADVFKRAPAFMGVLRGPNHVFERVNDRYDLLVSGRKLVGRTVLEALPEVAEQGFIALLDEVYRSGEPYVGTDARVTFEAYGDRPREDRYVDFVYQPLRDADGSVSGIIVQGVDQTARKHFEREREELLARLREQDSRKDDFIALLAHELRNPLAPIRNGLQVLRLAAGDAAATAKARDVMERQLAHMVRLVDDLLDVSRINRNKMELRLDRVLLPEVLNAAIETAGPAISAQGHELITSLPDVPVYLNADLTRLAQVFGNLLTNSAKYTGRGGRIWLTAEPRGKDIVISVRDTGIGIPAESLHTIFDMFSQVNRSIERTAGGLGIGLALVKGLVEMHGGSVSAASEGDGSGSTFTVVLPMASAPDIALAPSEPTPAKPGSKRRVLVVDDNLDGADSLAMMLELIGNEVAMAHDGLEAVERAERFHPELILMDVGMPRMNGLEATSRIRQQPWGKKVKIFALTGWGQEGDRSRSHEAGCDGHLVKPVQLADLEELLNGLRPNG